MAVPGVPPDPSIGRSSGHRPVDRAAIQARLKGLAENLPERLKLPFPFSGIIGFSVGDGSPILASHFPGQQVDFSPDTPMNILSVGKLFTAIAIMQLVEEGKLSLDTPISELLDPEELDVPLKEPYEAQKPQDLENLKANYHKITVRHLLSHTAGFVKRPGTETMPEGESWNSAADIGKKQYSNYGFQLLALIIGKHSSLGDPSDYEKGFRRHIEQEIFKRAGMSGAIREAPKENAEIPKGDAPKRFEVKRDHTLEPVTDVKEPYPHGNGCWRMPAGDLLLFAKALQSNTLINEVNFRSMIEGNPPLGFNVDTEGGRVVGYGHPGGGPGQSSFVHTWLTDPPITAAVLSNFSTGSHVKPMLDPVLPGLISI